MLRIAEYDATERNDIALHESFGCLVLLGAASAMYFVEIIRSSLSASFLTPSFIEMVVWLVQDPMLLLYFAVGFLSLQLCWVRWRRRSDVVTWQLAALPREHFVWNWFSLAALAIVAVPTASIYSFVYWLGPWYLYR